MSAADLNTNLGGAPKASDNYRASALLGYLIVLICIFGSGIWAAFAVIDSAVVAFGQVVIDGRRQVIQHLEGGIVRFIGVNEGQSVKEGDVLIELDEVETGANAAILQSQLDFARAREARLLAEIAGKREIEFPSDLTIRKDGPEISKILTDERVQFDQRWEAFDSQIMVLKSREESLKSQIGGLQVEREANVRRLNFIEKELVGIKDLAAKGLVTKSRWLRIEQEKAQLEGDIGRGIANESAATDNLKEISLQMNQLMQKRQEDNYAALNEERKKIDDLPNRIKVMKDRVKRSKVIAPKSGVVQNVRVSTLGQVIRPGDLLLEIVPIKADMTVDVNIPVNDIDSVSPGLNAEVRFSAFHSRETPVMFGKIRSVSRDRLVDEATREPYFLARIEINEASIPVLIKSRLQAGMPAEVIVPRGERTVLYYIIQPLSDALYRTFREK